MNHLLSCLRFHSRLSAAEMVLVLFLLAGPAGAQILTNGGFESGLGSWSSQLSGTGAATFANTATSQHSGTNALLVTVSSPGSAPATNSVQIVSSSFTASGSDTYVLRFWANTDTLDASLGVNLLGATPAFPQIPFELSTNSMAAGAEEYQEYLYAFKASGTVSIAFNFQTAAKYWLDDVEVLDLTNNDGFDVPMTYLWQWGELNFFQTNSSKIAWTGGDNDKSCLLPDGSVAWIFNDSYATTLTSSYFYSNIRGNSSLPHNCVVHQIGTNLIWLNNGANPVFVPTNTADYYWIGDSVLETNNLMVLLKEVNASGVNVAEAVATMPLPGLTLSSISEIPSTGSDDFNPLLKGDDGYYYIYNAAKVARVPLGGLAVNSDWTFWNGSTWVTDHTQSVAIPNFQGSAAFSLTRLATSNYCAVYKPAGLDIYAQFAPTPMGPWGSGIMIYPAPNQGGESLPVYAPNICAGTGSNGIYTIGYSDDGCTENWFTKSASDKSWYNPHFVTANLLALSPYTPNNNVAVPNFGFETPSVANNQYNPSGGSWTFSGVSGNGSGIVANGSAFSNPNAPQGVQAAFVQKNGTISQAISGFIPGLNYTLSFFAAERLRNAQSWNVTVNGAVIASYNPGTNATSFVNYTASFTPTAVTNTVAFVGTDLAGGDNTVFIDNVQISPPPILPTVQVNIGSATGGQPAGRKLVLTWPAGILLQATNVNGPWTTNYAPSPYTNQFGNPRMFYRVLVQ